MDLGVDGADEKDGNPVEAGSRSEDISGGKRKDDCTAEVARVLRVRK